MIIKTRVKGREFQLDDEDYERLKGYLFVVQFNKYTGFSYVVVRAIKAYMGLLHRLIMNPPKGMVVDHINHDTMDNRKANLRICTQAQNIANSRKTTKEGCSSKYKGVMRLTEKTKAQLQTKRNFRAKCKNKFIGLFEHEEDAARAYDRAAIKAFGEYACLNFPPP